MTHSPEKLITVRLRLKDKHASRLNQMARSVNLVWNYCNEIGKFAWERDRKWLSGYDLQKLTAGSSKLLGLNSSSIQMICHQYSNSRKKVKRASIRFRGKKSLGWIPLASKTVRFVDGSFTFMGETYQTMHNRAFVTDGSVFRSGSFAQDKKGNWYINLMMYVPTAAKKEVFKPVGIDLGLKEFAVTSDGDRIAAPRFYRQAELKMKSVQRAGKKKQLRNLHAKVANRRKDFLHKLSKNIVSSHSVVFLGDIEPMRIARGPFGKSVFDAGWTIFRDMLAYKAIMHGAEFYEVDERRTSRTCNRCGATHANWPRGLAGLEVREWRCDDCDTVHDRDVNAAANILRVGLDTLVEGACRESGGSSPGVFLAHKGSPVIVADNPKFLR